MGETTSTTGGRSASGSAAVVDVFVPPLPPTQKTGDGEKVKIGKAKRKEKEPTEEEAVAAVLCSAARDSGTRGARLVGGDMPDSSSLGLPLTRSQNEIHVRVAIRTLRGVRA